MSAVATAAGYGTLVGYLPGTPCAQHVGSIHALPVYMSGSVDVDSVVVGDGSMPASLPTKPCTCGWSDEP